VRLLWGEDTAELQMALGHVPHVAMYLSLQLDSETLQEEVGRLREEVEACGRRCDDGLADLREELANRTARLDGALGEAGGAMAALNGSLQSARWTLQQYGGDLLDLSSANDDIIADVSSASLSVHLEPVFT
jgi:chromosome segregation ATPase